MNSATALIRRFVTPIFTTLCSWLFALNAAHAVDIAVITDAPVAYKPFSMAAKGVRLFDQLVTPATVVLKGSRIVVTLVLPNDRGTASNSNIASFEGPVLPPGTYTVEVIERGALIPERTSVPVTVTVPPVAQAPTQAFSVFDRKIGKFFLTSSASDAAALIASNTATGPQWIAIEDNIRVWTQAQPFTVPVCRFYVPAAAVHFFSADETNDCRKLRRLSGFVDEGTAFHVIPPYREPDSTGFGGPAGKFMNVCPAGTDPVYRMFDDTVGHAAHRYTASPDVVDGFVAFPGNKGYKLEGVAFCSPRS